MIYASCQVPLKSVYLEKKIFEGVLPYMDGGHLGHMTWIIYIYIGSLFIEMSHVNLASIGQAVLEKCLKM